MHMNDWGSVLTGNDTPSGICSANAASIFEGGEDTELLSIIYNV